ncbi:MAG: M20/M25/M40 family metallo-hydrolase [Planctomycetes bacterium]|nr:M20/M25/M40 family metallo-hydrolase [Planctomycetota bacterium]
MKGLDRAACRAWAERVRATYERWLRRLVEIPSVSSDPARSADVARVARAAGELVRSVGGRARVVATGGHPMLVGELAGPPGAPRLTLYNHLDVQPADRAAEGWSSEPFRLVRRRGRYFGRGTTDDKGPALAALFGAVAARDAGVPVTVKLLWEGEEEIGSPHLARTLRRLGRSVETDAVVISDSAWLTRTVPTVTAGLRGWQGFLFRLETGDADAHSGIVGGAVRNPLGELMDLACALHDPRSGRVKVPGFYDDVRPLTAREREEFRRSGFTVRAFRRDNRVRRLRSADPLEVMERTWARPTFEVHGLVGGHQGPGLKAVVPARAELKASCRLAPGQDPARVAALVAGFARRHNRDVDVEVAPGGSPATRWDPTDPLAAAVRVAVEFAFGRAPAFVRDGGTIGAVGSMREILGCPVGFLDLSLPDHGYHGPDENFEWPQAEGGIAAFARLIREWGAARNAGPRARLAPSRASGAGPAGPDRRRAREAPRRSP